MLEPKKHYYLGIRYADAPASIQANMPRHEQSVVRLLAAARAFIHDDNAEILIASLNQRIDLHLFAPFEAPCYHRLVELLRREQPALFDTRCARSHATGIYAMHQLLLSAGEEHQQAIQRSLGFKKSISLSIAQNTYGPWLNQAWIHVMHALKSIQSSTAAHSPADVIATHLAQWKTWQGANTLTELLVMPDTELVQLSAPRTNTGTETHFPFSKSGPNLRRWTWHPCQMLPDSSAAPTRSPLPRKTALAS